MTAAKEASYSVLLPIGEHYVGTRHVISAYCRSERIVPVYG